MKKIILAFDSYKGSLSQIEACKIASDTLKSISDSFSIISLPLSDGGEGTISCIKEVIKGHLKTIKVTSPDNRIIDASYFISDDNKAYIELAEASGITKELKLNPLSANTYGFGELIKDALDSGIRDFTLSIGGSASTDSGCALASALGYKFFDKLGNEFIPCGGTLKEIDKIEKTKDIRIFESTFKVMCDCENPLCGKTGASYIYAGQKGATDKEIEKLDRGLIHLREKIKEIFNIDKSNTPGAGAAGGCGYGLMVFLNAKLLSGIDVMLDLYNYDEVVKNVDLIITGEGSLDNQSLMGKVLSGLYKRSLKKRIISFPGISKLDISCLDKYNITAFEISKGHSKEESIKYAKEYLEDTIVKNKDKIISYCNSTK